MTEAVLQYDFEAEGVVKSYDEQKHMGIIHAVDGAGVKEIVYYGRVLERSRIKKGLIKPGTKVSCKVANRKKGRPKAKEIKVLP